MVEMLRPPTRCATIAQRPFCLTAYATVDPSGDIAGDVSSPAASVSWTNCCQRVSGAAPRDSRRPAAAIADTAATPMRIHSRRVTRGAPTAGAATAETDDAEDDVESVSSA